jgi:hypothetical protein
MSGATSYFLEAVEYGWEEQRTKAELEAFCSRTGESLPEALSLAAIEIAKLFDQRLMSHDDAMGKAASLYNAFFREGPMPYALYEVYWALDEAEYGSEQDDEADEDAPENRSRRAVRVVLSKFSGRDA